MYSQRKLHSFVAFLNATRNFLKIANSFYGATYIGKQYNPLEEETSKFFARSTLLLVSCRIPFLLHYIYFMVGLLHVIHCTKLHCYVMQLSVIR